jgi:hypothetical protein
MDVLVHHEDDGRWYLTCLDAGWDMRELDAQDQGAAQVEALVFLEEITRRRLGALRREMTRMNRRRG